MDVGLTVQGILNGLMLGSVYALVALGLTIVFGLLDIVNFAHGQLIVLGGYVAFAVVEVVGSFWLGLAASLVVVSLLGSLLEVSLFRRVSERPINGLLISIGLIAIIENFADAIWGPSPRSLEAPVQGVLRFGDISFAKSRLSVVVATVLILLALAYFLRRTRTGKAMRATAQNSDAASLMGIDVLRIRNLAMIIGSALAAFAGTSLGALFAVEPALGESPLIKGFVVLIIGGAGSPAGAVIAGVGLGIAESLTTVHLSTTWSTILPLLALVAVLLVKPEGLVAVRGRQAL
ncbi:MAG: branched-chain amino acid ABC transporter permease [Actinobacteria bacterium]|nr:branched-chain amino acid ABC transporter permease [Actinomycetota bacterium]